MSNTIKFIYIIVISLCISSCASQVSTKNSLITTIYTADKSELTRDLQTVINGLENYSITFNSADEAVVNYDPSNLLMGSASVSVKFIVASGLTKTQKSLKGIELVYRDVTPLFSQDTTFSGADVIDRIKISFDDYMDYKGVTYEKVARTLSVNLE
jgi:hypothetical protein